MGVAFSLGVVAVLILAITLAVKVLGLQFLVGAVLPYVAAAVFLGGMAYRLLGWGRSPVPFRIPTTGGQQRSLPWIKPSSLDNPSSTAGVIGRMALEILLFRSLFRNTKAELHEGPHLAYHWEKWLWVGALVFHWSMLLVVIRHLRFFTDPVPSFVYWVDGIDGFLRVGLRALYLTDITFLLGATYLLLRRFFIPQVRYISLPGDYVPLLLLLGIGISGVIMRYFVGVDVAAVKELAMGVLTFRPRIPEGIGVLFYVHWGLACALLAYFPFSKLVHMGGIFLMPTRNLPNDSRARRHVNPWNYPVKVHTYKEYEEEFREKMKLAGIPVEKE